jgi:hypothetical protein
MAFETSPEDPAYNAFASVVEMDEIIDFQSAKYGTDFGYGALLNAAKESFIVSGSQSLQAFKFNGTKVVAIPAQAYRMQFPRTGLYYPGTETEVDVGDGSPYVNPQEVKDYVGLWILLELSKKESAYTQSLKSKTVDGVTEVYGDIKRDFSSEAISPVEAIPAQWFYSAPVSIGFGGVGSFEVSRFP